MYIVKKFLLKNIIKLLKTSYSFLCENFVNFCFSVSFFFFWLRKLHTYWQNFNEIGGNA